MVSDVVQGRAISIQQPFVEQILRGVKKYEYRSQPTRLRERVYLYASKRPGDKRRWEDAGFTPGELPVGMIVGSVEIVGCDFIDEQGCYGYKLAHPTRYERHLVPERHPQPCFFFPFGPRGEQSRRHRRAAAKVSREGS